MGGGATDMLTRVLDPFDITGTKRNKKKAAKAEASAAKANAELAAKEEAERLAAEEDAAKQEDAAKAQELEDTKQSARLAGIAGQSQALAAEGSTSSRRRFLTGAK